MRFASNVTVKADSYFIRRLASGKLFLASSIECPASGNLASGIRITTSTRGAMTLIKTKSGIVDDTIEFVDQSACWKKIGAEGKDVKRRKREMLRKTEEQECDEDYDYMRDYHC
uniref:Uncharacterized protein n=1 Tax=Romanomermis culicivorax TaxID=13658 RepID=A0A915KRJ3_ROMCU